MINKENIVLSKVRGSLAFRVEGPSSGTGKAKSGTRTRRRRSSGQAQELVRALQGRLDKLKETQIESLNGSYDRQAAGKEFVLPASASTSEFKQTLEPLATNAITRRALEVLTLAWDAKLSEQMASSTWDAVEAEREKRERECEALQAAWGDATGPMAERLDALNAELKVKLQSYLDTLEGESFGSLEANQRFAASLNVLLQRLGQRLVCQKEGCGLPAHLRVVSGTAAEGVFRFQHRGGKLGSNTRHLARARIPNLTLCSPMEDE